MRFWKLEDRIYNDKKKCGVQVDMRRSTMHLNVLELIREGAMGVEDLADFSEEFRDKIQSLI